MTIRYSYDKTYHPVTDGIIEVLEKSGILRRIEEPNLKIDLEFLKTKWTGDKHVYKPVPPIGFCEVCNSDDKNDGNHILSALSVATIGQYEKYENASDGVDRFLKNHQSIESNIEIIAKENLGLCEERKVWLKELKAAVKEYGHDSVLESFYEWTLAQGNFMGRKPVSLFLRNISSNINMVSRKKPTVTNPSLSKVEERVAYISDNRIFFTGDYRVKLAGLLKDFGPELVLRAFEDFFQDVDEKGMNWAARDFLQRAEVMIRTIQRKNAEAEQRAQLEATAYSKAQEAAKDEDEEEETEL